VNLEAELDRLYGVPLDEFVAERDALAKSLKGDGEAVAQVKSLRKPTVGAWALNQAVRRRRKETRALLSTAERMQAAQEALLSGGDPSALRKATREERALTSTLADCAEAIASEAGKSGPALRDRVRATLHAAAVDEEARAELETGRFTREREAVGLGGFGAGSASPASAPARKKPPTGGPARKPATRKRARTSTKPAGPPKRASASRGESASSSRGASAGKSASASRGASARAGASSSSRGERSAAREQTAREARLAEAEQELSEAREAHEAAVADHDEAAGALEAARKALREAEVTEREARRVMREHEREVGKRERKLDRMRPKR
jgi:hypothetical protein